MTCVPKLLHTNARLRVIGRALPAELLPYAAALLLPLLLLPPERVRALDLAHLPPAAAADQVSYFLSGTVVRTPLPSAPRSEEQLSPAAEGGGNERAPGSVDVQGDVRQLMAPPEECKALGLACPEECHALVLACPGLVPFVVEALRTLAERCARLPVGWELVGLPRHLRAWLHGGKRHVEQQCVRHTPAPPGASTCRGNRTLTDDGRRLPPRRCGRACMPGSDVMRIEVTLQGL